MWEVRVTPSGDFDNHAFASMAVRTLVDRGRTRLALLAPPSGLTYHGHTVSGFADAVAERGATEIPFNTLSIDQSIDAIRSRTAQMMRRPGRPDGLVSSASLATLALVAGIEDAGLEIGRDVDIVTKQSSDLMHLFRPQLLVVNENFRLAGSELARAVLALINGAAPGSLQSLAAPGEVIAFKPKAP